MLETLNHFIVAENIPSDLLEIEITESLFLERTELNLRNLAGIRDLGPGIALDDFGTGYSSMGYLAQLPLTVLKIDKTFVDDVHKPQGSAIISAVVALARGLGVDVIAEGVEHQDQAEQLIKLGCITAQGFYYSKPLPAEELESLLDESLMRLSGPRVIEG